jgi:hypothetical protein
MLLVNLRSCLQLMCDSLKTEQPTDCYVNPPCGCPNPGKEIQCEDCEYLEACLSRCQHLKISDNANPLFDCKKM